MDAQDQVLEEERDGGDGRIKVFSNSTMDESEIQINIKSNNTCQIPASNTSIKASYEKAKPKGLFLLADSGANKDSQQNDETSSFGSLPALTDKLINKDTSGSKSGILKKSKLANKR